MLASQDGSRKLIYDSDSFQPQAKGPEDIPILAKAGVEIVQECNASGDVITKLAIFSAIKSANFRELERLVYDYKVGKLVDANSAAGPFPSAANNASFPQQQPLPQSWSYEEVVTMYKIAITNEPKVFSGMTIRDFSEHMNNATHSHRFDAGLNATP